MREKIALGIFASAFVLILIFFFGIFVGVIIPAFENDNNWIDVEDDYGFIGYEKEGVEVFLNSEQELFYVESKYDIHIYDYFDVYVDDSDGNNDGIWVYGKDDEIINNQNNRNNQIFSYKYDIVECKNYYLYIDIGGNEAFSSGYGDYVMEFQILGDEIKLWKVK